MKLVGYFRSVWWLSVVTCLVCKADTVPNDAKSRLLKDLTTKVERELAMPCMDDPTNWFDSGGRNFDCGWYMVGDRCLAFGHMYRNRGHTANEACCACGGGKTTYASGTPTMPPTTLAPTPSPTPVSSTPTPPPSSPMPTPFPTRASTSTPPPSTLAPTTPWPTLGSTPTPPPTPQVQRDQKETLISFYAMGDIPYSIEERFCLNEQLRELDLVSPQSPSFLVHVGDIKAVDAKCDEQAYSDIAGIFTNSTNAVNYDPRDCFFLPGDNEYTDCVFPAEAWDHWTGQFGLNNVHGFGTFSSGSTAVKHQTSVLPASGVGENFAFFLNQVLFVGINMVGSKEPIGDEHIRVWQNYLWTRDQLEFYSGPSHDMKAAVIFGHASLGNHRNTHFGAPFRKLLRQQYNNLPVLYLHGDGHTYNERYPDRNNHNLWKITVDAGRKAPPIVVSIVRGADGTAEFQIDRRHGPYLFSCPSGNREVTWSQSA